MSPLSKQVLQRRHTGSRPNGRDPEWGLWFLAQDDSRPHTEL